MLYSLIDHRQDQRLPGHFEEGEVQLRTVCGLQRVQSDLRSSWQQHSNVSVGSVDTEFKKHNVFEQLFLLRR